MKKLTLAALAAGALFGIGLAMSGMTDPRRVLGFLDLFGDFDPTLLFVLGGAVATTMLLFRVVLRRGRPLLADTFRLSPLKHVDRRLLGGAAIFGIGWGLAGYCPGPALAGLGVGSIEALWFVPAMVAGLLLQRWVSRG
ncbi:MAG: YeeE/YedE family protein [Pseudoxanthomonas sp.]|nr:YeeE/YedE family protein [Pseudoxanthomonas sp.]